MIYIIFSIAIIVNIFNILMISNNNLEKTQKEKVLLVTYSISELLFLLFVVSFIEFTAVNLIIVLSFVCVWLLSKACICIENMNFEEIQEEEIIVEEKNIIEERKIIEDVDMAPEEETQIISTVEEEKFNLSDLVENSAKNVLIPTDLHELADIVESAKINKEEEVRMRRRSLALRTSKMMNNEK
jgi:hypothetical protein